MLGIRLREGMDVASWPRMGDDDGAREAEPDGPAACLERLLPVVTELVADGLLDAEAALSGRLVLTLRGRLMADAVTRALTEI